MLNLMIPQNNKNEKALSEINIQFINAIRELKKRKWVETWQRKKQAEVNSVVFLSFKAEKNIKR